MTPKHSNHAEDMTSCLTLHENKHSYINYALKVVYIFHIYWCLQHIVPSPLSTSRIGILIPRQPKLEVSISLSNTYLHHPFQPQKLVFGFLDSLNQRLRSPRSISQHFQCLSMLCFLLGCICQLFFWILVDLLGLYSPPLLHFFPSQAKEHIEILSRVHPWFMQEHILNMDDVDVVMPNLPQCGML